MPLRPAEVAGACNRLRLEMQGINPADLRSTDRDAMRALVVDLQALVRMPGARPFGQPEPAAAAHTRNNR